MIIVRLKGGLGNQMFQYALGRVLSIKNNTELLLDLNYFKNKNFTPREYNLGAFNIKARILQENKIPFLIKYFLPILEKINWSGNIYLDGYFQSEKYFESIEDIIRKDFTLKDPLSLEIQNLMVVIKKENSLCVHVRRGDYVGNIHHEVVNKEYYDKGIEKIKSLTKIDKIYVFSDDIKWCEENLSFPYPTMFVGEEYSGNKAEGHMALMSACHNFIIPNSSFSWWGAWLSTREEKIVICPKKWFNNISLDTNDLILKEWIRI